MLLASYPYLGMSLALALLLLGGLCARPAQRRMTLVSAVLQMPLGFLSVFFVPEYWQPARIFCFGAGLEDLLFSFAAGGLVWLLAVFPRGNRFGVEIVPRRVLARYAAFLLPGVATGALLWWRGLAAMEATIVVAAAATAVLVPLQRGALRLSAAGAAGFGILYAAVLKGCYLFWPQFADQWSTAGAWGLTVWELPLEELVWAAGNGAVWPLFMAHVAGVRASRPAGGPGRPVPAAYSDRSASTAAKRRARHAG